MSKIGMSSHQSTKMIKDEWLTPPEIIEELGPFDLDPCAPINRPWPTAKIHYTKDDDGLILDWKGKVWCNPPYGVNISVWLNKMALHNNGILLIFARTETNAFFNYIWNCADSALFIKGRIAFYHVNGEKAKFTGGAPSVLIAYGEENSKILQNCSIKGKYINLKI